MKKISIYTLSLLLYGLTACVEESELPAPPQAYEQEASKDGLAFNASAVSPILLAEVTTDSVKVCDFTPPAADVGTFTYEIAFDDKLTMPVSPQGLMAKTDLEATVLDLYGKRPEAREMKAVVTALMSYNGSVTRQTAPEIMVTATPEAPFIDKGYYLVGDMCGWDIPNALEFSHSGKDVYDDPLFTIIVETTGNNYWKVIPKTNIDNGDLWAYGVLGCVENGNSDAEGKLVTENPQAAKIEDAGFVRITLDMMDYSYRIEPFGGSPYLYVPGNHQGWSPPTAGYVFSNDMTNYQGFFNLDGEFKFTGERNWDGTNYGNGGDNTLSTDNGAGNMKVDKGFYLLEANIVAMTWKATPIETFGLIGDATPGGWDNSTPMEFDPLTSTYTVTADLIEKEFKFRANNGWDINLGGELNNLTFGGDNIKVSVAGKYKITLDLSDASKYKASFEKQ
ncbi:MAG: Outer membrane protein SusF domain-containing protein [Bacteroidales bacterium]